MNMTVRVRNISTGGALIEGDRCLPPDSNVQLDLPGCGSLGASVRWNEGRRMGVQFETEFDLRRLAPGKENGFGARMKPQAYTNLRYSEAAADKKALTAGDVRYR
jgi:PilZ domain-containing protein